jgi:transcriptional regulator with XRE-family HTH domain
MTTKQAETLPDGNFADRLTSLMRGTGKTARAIADEINIPAPTLSRYASGEREPRYEEARKIAAYFGLSTDALMLGKASLINEDAAAYQETTDNDWKQRALAAEKRATAAEMKIESLKKYLTVLAQDL